MNLSQLNSMHVGMVPNEKCACSRNVLNKILHVLSLLICPCTTLEIMSLWVFIPWFPPALY